MDLFLLSGLIPAVAYLSTVHMTKIHGAMLIIVHKQQQNS